MSDLREWNHKIFGLRESDFRELAITAFRYQSRENQVYGEYVRTLGASPEKVNELTDIPFLPVRFFKTNSIQTGVYEPEIVFTSSGTTGMQTSRHYVKHLSLYEESFTRAFEHFYGDIREYAVFALLPSYTEREGSSLVFMADRLIRLSGQEESGFYLDDDSLMERIGQREAAKKKSLLLGVTFALLDMAERGSWNLSHTIVMETGGMKGRRKEMIREELHSILKKGFGVGTIHSEYGMTELLSQAYSKGEGIFQTPGWMRILLRDEEDPLTLQEAGSGLINIIDLANIYSCSFIATDDIGKTLTGGGFEVLGRADQSDLRGCSLLVV